MMVQNKSVINRGLSALYEKNLNSDSTPRNEKPDNIG